MQPNSLLAYGNGRSYGDTCLNSAGALIDMRTMDRILGFDPLTGVLEAEGGTLLCDIIAHAAPYGYFPQVVPGTQFVTLGGAIANDVHGKNHHRRGTFGRHVEAFKLLRSDGSIHLCTPTRDARLYEATIGGMGLTGMILSASIRLMRVDLLDIDERVVPFRDLGEFFDLIGEADAGNEYVVAWLDQLASGNRAGRGLLMTGNHARHGARAAQKSGSRLAVPLQPPVNLLSKPFLRLFNFAYRNRKGAAKSLAAVPYQGFFFPLDGVRDWNRLYGPRGLYQHQSVVPEPTARAAIAEMLDLRAQGGAGLFPHRAEALRPDALAGDRLVPARRLHADAGLPEQGPVDARHARRARPHRRRGGRSGQPVQGRPHERADFRGVVPGLAHAGGRARPGLPLRFLAAHGTAAAQPSCIARRLNS